MERLHDPMMWQLSLVRLKTREDGTQYYGSVKDTAKNRNHGRFAKMEKRGDTKFSSMGAGVVHSPYKGLPRHTYEARRVAICTERRFAEFTGEVAVYEGRISKRMAKLAAR
jgi:hypothetical protein